MNARRVLLLVLCLPALVQAQEDPADRQHAAAAVAEVVGLAQPGGVPALLGLAHAQLVPAVAWKAQKLDLSDWFIEDRRPIMSWEQNAEEARAYDYTLACAHRLPVDAFARGARRDLTIAHWFLETDKYRGEIVHVEGTLKRLRRFDPDRLSRTVGIRDLYEGWVFNGPLYGSQPICVVFTELPDGLTISEKLDTSVSFDGFLFKRYRYQSADRWRDAPLLIGHMPVRQAASSITPAQAGVMESGTQLVGLFLAILTATLVLALILTWCYHRGDRQLRVRLRDACTREFVVPRDSELL